MWVLRQYSRANDELLSELPLEGFRLADAQELIGYAPTKLGSTPVDPIVALRLQEEGFPLRIEKDSEFFLDFDAEPEAVDREEAPETAVTS